MLRRKVLASAVALGATAVIMLFGAANAMADCSSRSGGSSSGSSSSGSSSSGSSSSGSSSSGSSRSGSSTSGRSSRGNSVLVVSAGGSSSDDRGDRPASSSADVSKDADQNHEVLSPPAPPGGVMTTPGAPSPTGGTSTPSSGTATDGPTVGGGSATTGAAGTETETVSTAPTPPNGAELAAAGSPAPAELPSQATPDESPVASPPAVLPDLSGLPGLFGDALGVTGPLPVAAGLSPDGTQSGVLVAFLALAVLLFLAGYQLVDRRDRGLAGARDAEGVARFK